MIAVPSEEPRFWAVPWSPPASLDLLSGDRRHDHVPQLGRQHSAACADQRERDLEARVVQLDVERREHHDRTGADRHEPDLRNGAGRAAGGHLGAEESEDQHRKRKREQTFAGLECVESQDHLEVDGDHEERAHQDDLLPDQARQPRAQLLDPQQRRVEQGVAAQADAPLLPDDESPEQRQTAEHQERRGREPQRRDLRSADRRRGAWLDESPDAAAQNREHDQAEPARGEQHADDVEARAALGRFKPGDLPADEQDEDHDDGLGREHVPPGELRRYPATDERPRGDRDRGDPPEHCVGEGALLRPS